MAEPASTSEDRRSWQNLFDVLRWTALHYPERGVHIVDQRGRQEFRTWAQILESSRRVGAALRERGMGRSERILFVFPTSFEFLSSFFGALSIGALPIPVAPPRPEVASAGEIAEYFLRTADRFDATSILFATEIERSFRPPSHGKTRLVCDYTELLDSVEIASTAPLPSTLPTIAYLQLTSGATGNARAVAVSHENILANLEAVGEALQVHDEDIGVSWLPNYTIMGLVGVVCFTLYWSLDVCLIDPERFLKRPEEWLWAFSRHGGTLAVAPSFSFQYCVRRAQRSNLEGLDLSTWRVAMSGGEPVRAEDMQAFGRRFGEYGLRQDAFMPVYGLTEATLAVTFSELDVRPALDTIDRDKLERHGRAEPVDRTGRAPHSWTHYVGVGKTLEGIDVRIVDEDGADLPDRQLGEIVVSGRNVTLGYVGDLGSRSEPNSRFEGDRLFTGDLGYVAEGELFVVGRACDLIRHVGGRRIFPEDLEFVVNKIDGVRTGTTAVFGVDGPEEASRDRLIVGFEAQDGADEQELADLVRSRIMRYFAVDPDEVLLLSPKSVPRSASGKIRRRVARELYAKGKLDRRARRGDFTRVKESLLRARHSLLKAGEFLREKTGEFFRPDD